MEKMLIECGEEDDSKADITDQIRGFFGDKYHLVKKVFSNELDYIQKQKEQDIVVLTTQLRLDEIEKNSGFKRLCVLKMRPWAETEELRFSEIKAIHYYSKVMGKYGKTFLCTSEKKCPQSKSLDKNQFLNYTKAGFIFYEHEKPDIESYKRMGFNYIGMVKKDL